MTARTCPTADELSRWARGRLSDSRASALESHLDECPNCQRSVANLPVPESVVEFLRQPEPRSPVDELPAPIVRRLEQLSSRPSWNALFDDTPETSGHSLDLPAAPDELGRLGHYRVIELIGAGGMGLVYRVEDERLLRPVALKLLRPRFARHEPARRRFLREARAMAALKHDHVVTVFEVGEATRGEGTTPYVAMELLSGESLASWMQRHPPAPAERVARIGHEAALGLAAAHAVGLIHRDIKPGNLWLETPEIGAKVPRVKLLDFGLADPFGPGAEPDGRTAGTPAYMAPEQARGEPLDARADLFALGVVLYELATGRLPNADFVPVRQLAPTLSPPLAALIEKLLAPKPEARPANADEVAATLAALCPPEWDTPARRRRVRIAAWLAAVSAAAVTAYHFLPADAPSPPPVHSAIAAGLSDEAWEAAMQSLPATERYSAVVGRLRELNPEFREPVLRVALDRDELVELELCTDRVTQIAPLRTCSNLRRLSLVGSQPGTGRLVEVAPLRGLSLDYLDVSNNPDLRELAGVSAHSLRTSNTGLVRN